MDDKSTTPSPTPEIPIIIASVPRVPANGYDLVRCVQRLFKSGMTVEEIALKACHSEQWIRMLLNMGDDLDSKLKTMTTLELFRWLKTPPLPLHALFPSSEASRITAVEKAAKRPVAERSETPAT